MSIITITLKNKVKQQYDLTNTSNITTLKGLVTRAVNTNDINRLTEIKNQLEKIPIKSVLEQETLAKITPLFQLPEPIDPFGNATVESNCVVGAVLESSCTRMYTPVLHFAPSSTSSSSASFQKGLMPELPIELPSNTLDHGETSFQELYACLMASMAQYTYSIEHLIQYSALVLNLFVHVATFTPHDGHGQAQSRESQLQYYRSQGNHTNASLFKELTKKPGRTGMSRLPLNEGFIKLIASDDFSPRFCAEIKKFNPKTGIPKPGKAVSSYVMTKIAHAGARKNNLSTLIQGMNQVVEGFDDSVSKNLLQAKLQAILPPTKTILELSLETCTTRINALLTEFNVFGNSCKNTFNPGEELSSRLLGYRISRIEHIKQQASLLQLKHIIIDSKQENITCLMIQLYPNCKITDDTYKNGVTNVLLSFFAALLNHYSEKQGLRLHTTRRQSFGFLRPTITDAGCLMIRLSLGLEPSLFDRIILGSLQQFDVLLEEFKFNEKTDPSVSSVFEYNKPRKVKKEGDKREPNAPDTYIRSVVRKDNLTLQTFQQAKAYIDQAAELSNGSDYLNQAMRAFLDQYIRNGVTLSLTSHLKQPSTNTVQLIESPTINLLQNTLAYAFDFVRSLVFKRSGESLEHFAHVYLHSLLKLFNNCQQAQHLLSNYAQIETTEFYYQGLLVIENILEYLISLDGLKQIQAELEKKPIYPIIELHHSELDYVNRMLQIPKQQLHLFFTDSGQQAITSALLTLSIMLHGPAADGHVYDSDIHLFGNTYYEIAEFIKDCKADKLKLEMKELECAKIIFVDISQINLLIEKLNSRDCPAMKALVIDMTHHPLFDQIRLRQLINTIHQSGVWVTLVESSLKHSQLGLDKYQAGKIITIAPPGETLPKPALDMFEHVSIDATHPLVAAYLLMVNTICRDKLQVMPSNEPVVSIPSKDSVSAKALVKRGFSLAAKRPIVSSELTPESQRPGLQ